MKRNTPRRSTRTIPGDRRLSALLGVALIGSVLTSGCKTATSPPTRQPSPIPDTQSVSESSGTKTEFHGEIAPDQEFNVHTELASVHESQGNHEAAVVEYQKAVDVCARKGSMMTHSKLGPDQQSLAQRRMAAALDRMGRFAQAEPHYLKALKLTPNDPKVWNDAGYSYYLQSRLADAERTLRTAESLDPKNQRVLTNLGLTLAAEGKNDEALAALTRAGGAAVGHANLGYILAAMGKTNLAREHYKSAVALQPELTAAREALARLEIIEERPVTAIASAAKPTPVQVAKAPAAPSVMPAAVQVAKAPAAPSVMPAAMPAAVQVAKAPAAPSVMPAARPTAVQVAKAPAAPSVMSPPIAATYGSFTRDPQVALTSAQKPGVAGSKIAIPSLPGPDPVQAALAR